MRIAIITTSYNRKEKTVKAFSGLSTYKKHSLDFFICDDASTDGTAEAVLKIIPNAHIIMGNGNLFWARGMHKAMLEAVKYDYDFYLMINDDVEFYEDAIDIMLETYYKVGGICGVTGATLDSIEEKTSYGGKFLFKKEFIIPNGEPQICELANWNCFLVNKEIIQNIGLIDSYYEHALADHDYSLMMKRAGYNIYLSSEYIGNCAINPKENTYLDAKLSRKKRFELLFSKKGAPIKSRFYYYKKNYKSFGIKGYILFFRAYIRGLLLIIVGM